MNVHKHLLIKADINSPITDVDAINQWLRDLVERIDMKILHGPISVYSHKQGNRGITGFCIIETSHIAIHLWDESEPGLLNLDVYSCKEFDPITVLNQIKIFDPVKIEYKFLDRDRDFEKSVIDPYKVIESWLSRITKKQLTLGSNKICPFAKSLPVTVVEKLSEEVFVDLKSETAIYIENTVNSTVNDLLSLCGKLKITYHDFVFLPDHPAKKTYIGNIETGNGYLPCIIAQPKRELDDARKKLQGTDYYDYWDQGYLDEIRSFD